MRRGIQRTRRRVDLGKLSSAVSRPGVDPRVWITLAQVDDVGGDAEEGIFADVTFLPSGEEQSVLVGSAYAGAGYGQVIKPKVGDLVVVAVPEGSQDSGPIIIGRMWNGAEPPPAGALSGDDVTDDLFTRVKDGDSFRLYVDGGGQILLDTNGAGDIRVQTRGAGKVKLGEGALQPAVLGNDLCAWMQSVENRLSAAATVGSTVLAAYNLHTHGVTTAPGTTATTSAPAAPSFPTPPVAPEVRATKTELK